MPKENGIELKKRGSLELARDGLIKRNRDRMYLLITKVRHILEEQCRQKTKPGIEVCSVVGSEQGMLHHRAGLAAAASPARRAQIDTRARSCQGRGRERKRDTSPTTPTPFPLALGKISPLRRSVVAKRIYGDSPFLLL